MFCADVFGSLKQFNFWSFITGDIENLFIVAGTVWNKARFWIQSFPIFKIAYLYSCPVFTEMGLSHEARIQIWIQNWASPEFGYDWSRV